MSIVSSISFVSRLQMRDQKKAAGLQRFAFV